MVASENLMRSICLPAFKDFKMNYTLQLKDCLSHCYWCWYPWPDDTLYGITLTTYKQSFSPLYLSVLSLVRTVFIISVWAQSLLSPRERTSSEASSSQPTNNTPMLHLIPLWLHIAKWNCTRTLCENWIVHLWFPNHYQFFYFAVFIIHHIL